MTMRTTLKPTLKPTSASGSSDQSNTVWDPVFFLMNLQVVVSYSPDILLSYLLVMLRVTIEKWLYIMLFC